MKFLHAPYRKLKNLARLTLAKFSVHRQKKNKNNNKKDKKNKKKNKGPENQIALR